MKKNVLITLFILATVTNVLAQNQLWSSSLSSASREYWGGRFNNMSIGFKFSPAITFVSFEGVKNFKGMSDGAAKINMTVGPVADFYFAQKYAFSTGLWYTVKGVSYNIYNSFYDTDVFVQKPLTKDEIRANAAEFNLQYLQIPVSLKIFSDQVTPGMPFYIQFGGTLDINIAEKPVNYAKNALVQYRDRVSPNSGVFGFGEANLLLGAGFEKKLGTGTDAFFFGLQYQRGLSEINRGSSFADMITKTNQLVIDFGLKF